MEAAEIFAMGHEGLKTLIMVSAPVMGVALLVGLVVSLFQALTQMQEATLTFVPKLLAVFLTLAISMPYMVSIMTELNSKLHERISTIK